jgi:hypothetical protein
LIKDEQRPCAVRIRPPRADRSRPIAARSAANRMEIRRGAVWTEDGAYGRRPVDDPGQ